MFGIIYKATNKINNKVYIGRTKCSLKKRQYEHQYLAKNNKGTLFHRAIKKYGQDNFEWIKIDEAENNEKLDEKEIYWIEQTKANNRELGYNLTIGGRTTTGYKVPQNVKEKISKTNKEYYKNLALENHPTYKEIDTKKLKQLWFDETLSLKNIEDIIGLEKRAIKRHLAEEGIDVITRREKLISYKKINKLADSIDYRIITSWEIYKEKNIKQNIEIKCNKDFVFKMRASAFLYQNQRCPMNCPNRYSCEYSSVS